MQNSIQPDNVVQLSGRDNDRASHALLLVMRVLEALAQTSAGLDLDELTVLLTCDQSCCTDVLIALVAEDYVALENAKYSLGAKAFSWSNGIVAALPPQKISSR